MPDLYFGKGAYRRDRGNLPEFTLRNMFVEKTTADDKGVVIQSRAGLDEYATRGTGPIRGLFAKSGVFNQDLFTLSGTELYRGADLLGSIEGDGPCSFAASSTQIVVTTGGIPFLTDGITVSLIDFPDIADVRAVAFLGGYFIFLRAGSHRFYWSAVLDASSIDALDYASAESSPDELLDVVVIGDELWLMGAATVEVWALTGDADIPFSRVEARLYRRGVISTGCSAELDNTAFTIGNDGIVYRFAERPIRVSDEGIEERIADSSTLAAFAFEPEGHKFFCIRTDQGTFAYDAATAQWWEPASFERTNWRAQCAAVPADGLVFGDDEDGTIWEFGSTFADDGDVLERRFTAGFPLNGGAVSADNIQVEVNVGRTALLTGQGSAPKIEMRSSRDGGATYTAFRAALMGAQGRYRTRTIWRRCGMFDSPGGLFEMRMTDPAPLRVSGVTMNEPLGGRAR